MFCWSFKKRLNLKPKLDGQTFCPIFLPLLAHEKLDCVILTWEHSNWIKVQRKLESDVIFNFTTLAVLIEWNIQWNIIAEAVIKLTVIKLTTIIQMPMFSVITISHCNGNRIKLFCIQPSIQLFVRLLSRWKV